MKLKKILGLSLFFCTFYSLIIPGIYFTLSDLFFTILFTMLIIKNFSDNSILYNNNLKMSLFSLSLILGGYLVSGIFNTISIGDYTSMSIQYIFVFAILMYVMNNFKSDTLLKLSEMILLGISFITLFSSFLKFFLPSIYTNLINLGIFIGDARLGGFIGANGLSKTIVLCIPLLYVLYTNNVISRRKTFIYILIFIFGLIQASSFGGLISFVITAVILWLLNNIFIKKTFLTNIFLLIKNAVIGIFVVSFVLFINNFFKLELFNVFSERVLKTIFQENISEAGSFNIKFSLMETGLNFIQSSPIIGIGYGNFSKENVYEQNIHNLYISLWVEGGLLSFIGLLLFILYFLFISLKILMSSKNKYSISIGIGLFALTLAFSINIFTGTSGYVRHTMIPLILIGTIASRQLKKVKEENRNE
ncbi:hypothetical protein BBH88_07250 [Planococcus antarcticus DSM 14505]|uniref:O-antigen ligase-related domain-containing protein n=1 Tax=Planococcus antarcticus DSM 14505 TaxID=1185653 RepID=A0ABM6D3Z8_9BACL|nr:O-antigen ligase family protein [Planococcus antarcticus]ANU10113.1 hypothetical protein BBH88_07250 [Planococcus antarcticus DSM 14505]